MTFRDILENIEFFKYPILVGVLLCLAASIIGVVLVLKRFSMIGDGLSHVSFGVIAVAMCLNLASDLALIIAIPIVIFFAYILLRVGQSAKMKGDAIIALLSSSSLAIAYLFLNETGTSIDIDSYLFGSILFATKKDFLMILPVCIVVVLFFIFFYNRIFSITFDETFAKATGINTKFYNMVISILTAIIIVLGMRIMGTLLISSLIIFPALTSMRIFKKFKVVVITSALISITSFLLAFFLFPNFPSGASVVIVNLTFFVSFALIGFVKKFVR